MGSKISFRKKIEPFYNEYAVGKYGTGSIYDNIKNKIIKNNGKIYLNHNIESLINENHRIKKIKFSNGKVIKLSDDTIILSSLPITLTSNCLDKKVS